MPFIVEELGVDVDPFMLYIYAALVEGAAADLGLDRQGRGK